MAINVTRSFDVEVLTKACDTYDYKMRPDNKTWLSIPENRMYVRGDDIGLATYDYPGLYAVHWFFKSRGRKAIRVTAAMLDALFTETDAKVVRGVIHMDNKPCRFLSRYLGFERISIEEFLDGPNELVMLHKEAFYQIKGNINGS